MKKIFKTFLRRTLMFVSTITLGTVSFASNQSVDKLNSIAGTSKTTIGQEDVGALSKVISGIFAFLPWLQWIVTAGGILMFAISVFNLYRGQQLDVSELFKNIVIYGIIIGAAWFGPLLIVKMSSAGDSKATGAQINVQMIEQQK